MEYFAFQWHITEACDQRCKHCYIYALGSHAGFRQMGGDDMDTVLANIKEFGRKARRTPYLYITGGDLILHPGFWSLAEKLRAGQIPFAIPGNPFHLDDDVCRRLSEYGCRKYQLSLDGLEVTHDRIRRPGSFRETIEAIPCLQRAGMTVAIMATVSKWNYRKMPELIDVVVKHKADVFAFARYCPDADSKDACCSPEAYKWMLEQCWERFERYKGGPTWFNLKDHLWTLFKYEKGLFNPADYPGDNTVYDGCNCGNCHLTILSDGAVYACRRMESKVGNALRDDLYDLFVGEKMDAYRKYEEWKNHATLTLLAKQDCPLWLQYD